MKVILSVQSIKHPLTGIGRYTYELARNLEILSEIEEIKYFSGNEFLQSIPDAADLNLTAAQPENKFNKVKRVLARSKLVVDAYRYMRAKTEGDLFRGLHDHVYHGTNFYVPHFSGPTLATIHDLSIFTMPQFHPRERVLYLGKETEAAINRANMLITDSHFVKGEIINRWGIPEHQVGVAKLACGEEFRPRTLQDVKHNLAKYGLSHGGYSLYAGTIEPRKNLNNLIDAYRLLPLKTRKHFPLVLAGYKGWNNLDIMERVARGSAEGWIRNIGYVHNDELPLLYSGARLFVFPSLYEGFGLPVLEAMASGVPVLTSNRSSLPEVGGNAVLYVDPMDVEGMTESIQKGLLDEIWRVSAVLRGLEQAKTFSWAQCAQTTLALYRLASGERSDDQI